MAHTPIFAMDIKNVGPGRLRFSIPVGIGHGNQNPSEHVDPVTGATDTSTGLNDIMIISPSAFIRYDIPDTDILYRNQLYLSYGIAMYKAEVTNTLKENKNAMSMGIEYRGYFRVLTDPITISPWLQLVYQMGLTENTYNTGIKAGGSSFVNANAPGGDPDGLQIANSFALSQGYYTKNPKVAGIAANVTFSGGNTAFTADVTPTIAYVITGGDQLLRTGFPAGSIDKRDEPIMAVGYGLEANFNFRIARTFEFYLGMKGTGTTGVGGARYIGNAASPSFNFRIYCGMTWVFGWL